MDILQHIYISAASGEPAISLDSVEATADGLVRDAAQSALQKIKTEK